MKRNRTLLMLSLLSYASFSETGKHGENASGNSAYSNSFLPNVFRGIQEGFYKAKSILLRSDQGKWTPLDTNIVFKKLADYPNLINGIAGKRSPLSGLCNNYKYLSVDERKGVIAKVIMSLAYAETEFNKSSQGATSEKGDEKARGILQLSANARAFGCWKQGYNPWDDNESIDCALKIMDRLYTDRGLPIANSETAWSVLRPHFASHQIESKSTINMMERRFLPTFLNITSECHASYAAEENKPGYKPPAELELVNNSGVGDDRDI